MTRRNALTRPGTLGLDSQRPFKGTVRPHVVAAVRAAIHKGTYDRSTHEEWLETADKALLDDVLKRRSAE